MSGDKPQPYIRYPVRDMSDEEEEGRGYRPGFLFSKRKRQQTTSTSTTTTTTNKEKNNTTQCESHQQQPTSSVSSNVANTSNTSIPVTVASVSGSTAAYSTGAVVGSSNLPTSDPWCKCGNCSEMPPGVERKCCLNESFDLTNFQDPGFKPGEHCVLTSEFVLNSVLQTGHLQLAWVAQRRFLGFRTPQEIDVSNMNNSDYRFCAYRSYINFIYGFLGRRNRRVIPACVVGHIRNSWPSPDGIYVGFKLVDDDNEEEEQYVPADELQAIADGTEI